MDELFRDAQTLADFSNLEPSDESYFRANFPDFLPSAVFEVNQAEPNAQGVYRLVMTQEPGKPPQSVFVWTPYQRALRLAWQKRFPLDSCLELIVSLDRFTKVIVQKPEERKLSEGGIFQKSKVWPFQRAIMFLGMQPWRARFCVCGKRFVADIPARRFCSDKCFQDSRRQANRSWWREHGAKWRQSGRKTSKKRLKKRTAKEE